MLKRAGNLVFIAVAGLIMLYCAAAQAGWMMVDKNGETTLLSHGKMKTTWTDGGLILDKKGNITFYSSSKKIYGSGTLEELCSGVKNMMDQVMKNIPPEQMAMMKEMMGKGRAEKAKFSIVEAGDGGKIAGMKTIKYQILRNGELYKESWIMRDEKLMKEYKTMIGLLTKFAGCTKTEFTPDSADNAPEYLKLLENGIEFKSVIHELGTTKTDSEVVEAITKDIPKSEFEAPAGYKKVGLMEVMGMQEGLMDRGVE